MHPEARHRHGACPAAGPGALEGERTGPRVPAQEARVTRLRRHAQVAVKTLGSLTFGENHPNKLVRFAYKTLKR